MKRSIATMLAGAALLAAATQANAIEPIALSDADMDRVTAGDSVLSLNAIFNNVGNLAFATATATSTPFGAAAITGQFVFRVGQGAGGSGGVITMTIYR